MKKRDFLMRIAGFAVVVSGISSCVSTTAGLYLNDPVAQKKYEGRPFISFGTTTITEPDTPVNSGQLISRATYVPFVGTGAQCGITDKTNFKFSVGLSLMGGAFARLGIQQTLTPEDSRFAIAIGGDLGGSLGHKPFEQSIKKQPRMYQTDVFLSAALLFRNGNRLVVTPRFSNMVLSEYEHYYFPLKVISLGYCAKEFYFEVNGIQWRNHYMPQLGFARFF